MTEKERKKAIEVLDDMKVKINIPKAAKTQNDRNWALDEAINALSQEQESCDDAISRSEAQTEIMMSKSITTFNRDLWIRTKDAVQIIRELQPVTPSKRKGHWLHKGQGIYCSECGKESGYNPFGASRFSDYCPSCGIEMEIKE